MCGSGDLISKIFPGIIIKLEQCKYKMAYSNKLGTSVDCYVFTFIHHGIHYRIPFATQRSACKPIRLRDVDTHKSISGFFQRFCETSRVFRIVKCSVWNYTQLYTHVLYSVSSGLQIVLLSVIVYTCTITCYSKIDILFTVPVIVVPCHVSYHLHNKYSNLSRSMEFWTVVMKLSHCLSHQPWGELLWQ